MDSNSSNDILAEVLGSDLSDKAAANAKGVRKDNYKQLVAFQNVSSYSIDQVFHACPRKFQLTKLEADNQSENYLEEENTDFAFGHAVGAGVATFDETRDIKKAIWAAFLAWDIDLFAAKERKANRPAPNKSFHHAIWSVKMYEVFFHEETDLDDYEVVKNEATIAVDFENGHFYVGHIDTLLQNKSTGHYKVKENKTTVYGTVNPVMYANSDQALSYTVVIDSLGASEYEVLYTVYSTTEQRWMQFEFTKSAQDKAEWLQDQGCKASAIDQYRELNFFPRRGASCISFGKPCQFYETCGMDSDKIYGKTFSDLKTLGSIEELEEIEHIDFGFTWSQIVKKQQELL